MIKVIGHRGSPRQAPENTLASFKKALESDVSAIELDVHLSADGQVVVLHDANVKRTTNTKGTIGHLKLSQIKQLDAGSHFSAEYAGEPIPTLEEVLLSTGDQDTLLIELKYPRHGIYTDLVTEVLRLIAKHKAESRITVQSFEPRYIRDVKERNPIVKCQQLLAGKAPWLPLYCDRRPHLDDFKPIAGIDSVNVFYKFLSKRFVEDCHRAGVGVGAYTVNDTRAMLKAASLGVDSLITDYPVKAIEILKRG